MLLGRCAKKPTSGGGGQAGLAVLSPEMRCWDREVMNPQHNVDKQPHSCSQQHAPTGERVTGTEKSSFSYSWFCHAGDGLLSVPGGHASAACQTWLFSAG